MKKPKADQHDNPADVPYVMRMHDGRTVLVLVPADACEFDESGQVAFLPAAVRFLDRVRAAAGAVPPNPSPAYIRTLREVLSLTQSQLAAKLHVDKMTVARWEWGKSKPTAAKVKALDRLRRMLGRKGVVIAA